MVQGDRELTGIGEGTPRHFVTGETAAACHAAARDLAAQLVGLSAGTAAELISQLRRLGRTALAAAHPAAWCALELGCLDLWGREAGVPLWRLFAEVPARTRVRYSAVVPLLADAQALRQTLQLIHSLQPPAVKLKVASVDQGLADLALARAVLGPAMDLRLDANGAFSAAEALDFLRRAAAWEIRALEQPVARDDLEGLHLVASTSQVPIIADESMYTAKGPEVLIDKALCQGLNIRVSSCGGLIRSLELWQRARARGLFCQIGSHVGETAVLSAAGRCLAAITGDYRYLEGSLGKYVLREELGQPDISFGPRGEAPLLVGAGCGISLDQEVLQRWGQPLPAAA